LGGDTGIRNATIVTFIDPEELPFSQDEVYEALRLTSSERRARSEAASIAQMGREARAARLAAQQARARGTRDPAEANRHALYLSPEFFALLAAVSLELRARVDTYWESTFAQNHAYRVRNALRLAGASSLDDAAAVDVRAAVDAADAEEQGIWRTVRAGVESELRRRGHTPAGSL